jgi:hypothetical protein
MRTPLTIFMFGYWGWGNATKELVEAVDAVEKKRDFKPPLFVDIRVHRKVRATGFRDDAFEQIVGRSRHLWMPDLGNLSVLPQHRSDRIDIKSPQAAGSLLALAIERAKRRQRIIYFCSCKTPCDCHRYTVAQLLIKAAKRRGTSVEVVEWPGGEPSTGEIEVPRREIPKDHSSRLHLASVRPLSKFAGLAVGSLLKVTDGEHERMVCVAPAMVAPKGWYLPILQNGRGKVIDGTSRAANRWRKEYGYLPLRTTSRR